MAALTKLGKLLQRAKKGSEMEIVESTTRPRPTFLSATNSLVLATQALPGVNDPAVMAIVRCGMGPRTSRLSSIFGISGKSLPSTSSEVSLPRF